ncbi:MAG: alginate export family protein [Planctomycetota bacterium]|jgi:hypothetical protein
MRRPSRARIVSVALVMVLAAPLVAAGQETAPVEVERPKFTFLRFNEDWSVLADMPEDQKTDLWDALKYVPLSDDGSVWASFGGHMRARFEAWDGFAFGAPATDDDEFVLWRMLLHADIHFSENLRVFVEGKSAASSDRDLPGGRRPLDVDTLDLEQAFVDIRFPLADGSLTVRPGRQVFLFGRQRLVSPLPWANTMRRWDGVSAALKTGAWTVTGFWTQFAPVQKYEFNDPTSSSEFWGVYATAACPWTGGNADLYYLGIDRDGVTFNGTTGDEERHTLGGRLFGKCGESNFDYDVEGAYQFGDLGSGDIDAFAFTTEVGWKAADMACVPRFFGRFDYASGDDSAGGDVETFNQLFPLGHAYLGYIDIVGWQNVMAFAGGVTFKPAKKLTAGVTGHWFRRAESSDAFYNAGGGVVRPGAGSSDKDIGAEIDVTLKWAMNRHTAWLFGYSHFFPSDFIDDTGADDDINFFYAQVQYTF